MLFDADFVDVFQVRGVARQEHGQYYQPVVGDDSIAFYYRGLDNVMRQTLVKLAPKPTESSGAGGPLGAAPGAAEAGAACRYR